MRRGVMMVLMAVLVLAACAGDDSGDVDTSTSGAEAADDTPTAGPVTIVTQADFSDRPVVGSFEVTVGADLLGCSNGTFVDDFVARDDIKKVMTCDSGSNEGIFTLVFALNGPDAGPGDENGPWSVVEGSGGFVGLQGSGDWSMVEATDGSDQGVETLTGDIEYTS